MLAGQTELQIFYTHIYDLLEWCTGCNLVSSTMGISGQSGQESSICLDSRMDDSADLHSTLESLGGFDAREPASEAGSTSELAREK